MSPRTVNDEVMSFVEQRLRRAGAYCLERLQRDAAAIDPEIAELSPREFEARYPHQIVWKLAYERNRSDREDGSPTMRGKS